MNGVLAAFTEPGGRGSSGPGLTLVWSGVDSGGPGAT